MHFVFGKGPVGWLVSSEEYKRSSKKSSVFSKDAEAIEGDRTQIPHMQQTSWERDSLSSCDLSGGSSLLLLVTDQ